MSAATGAKPNPVALAASRSPVLLGPAFTDAADQDELSFREHAEPYPDPLRDIPRFIDSKRLPAFLDRVLGSAGIVPRGTVVELGAGVCWLSAALARRPEVERVIAVEFSRRRLERLAPIAIAHLAAPAGKIERRLADFHDPGLADASADLVVTDAAFHHSSEPVLLARTVYRLLRPGGTFLMLREPTVARLRRRRDHGLEGCHGDFEHEYRHDEYLRFLREAGLEPDSVPAPGALSTLRGRAILHPPFSWLNGLAFSEYAYIGYKAANGR